MRGLLTPLFSVRVGDESPNYYKSGNMSNLIIEQQYLRKIRSLFTKKHPNIHLDVSVNKDGSYDINTYRLKPSTSNKKEIYYSFEGKISIEECFRLCCACYLVGMKMITQKSIKQIQETGQSNIDQSVWIKSSGTIPHMYFNSFQSSAGVPTSFVNKLSELVSQFDSVSMVNKNAEQYPIAHVFNNMVKTGKVGNSLAPQMKLKSPLYRFFYGMKVSTNEREKRQLINDYQGRYADALGASFNARWNIAMWLTITLHGSYELSEKFFIENIKNDRWAAEALLHEYELISGSDSGVLSDLYINDLEEVTGTPPSEDYPIAEFLSRFPREYIRNYMLFAVNAYRHSKDPDATLFHSLNLPNIGFGFKKSTDQNPHAYDMINPHEHNNILREMHDALNPNGVDKYARQFVSFLGDMFDYRKGNIGDHESKHHYISALNEYFKLEEELPTDHYSMALLALTGDYVAQITATKFLKNTDPNVAGEGIFSQKLIKTWMEFYQKTPFEAMQLPSITEEDKRWLVKNLN